MATDSAQSAPAPAPWRDLFLEHVSGMPSPEFVLSTVRRIPTPSPPLSGDGSGSSTKYAYVPRARTCVFRGFWAELPANPKNEAPRNPAGVYGSDLPTFTTDVRMAKVEELWGYGEEEDEEEDGGGRREGTGGGASVEAVWWCAHGPKTQWRVRGEAYVLAPGDVEGEGGREVVGRLRARMRRLDGKGEEDGSKGVGEGEGEGEGEKEWSFAREITAHFGNQSPTMRGSFRNPPPGVPVGRWRPVDGDGLGLGQKVTDLRDKVARANFRVVVIVPREVDRCDLSDPDRARRWLYTFVGAGGRDGGKGKGEREGEWEVVEVWP
ncbi:pyridoxamine 5'-phosphate oxidase-domain-containing protein [Biscogniauxia marginata]|nr:pyridoxamine 5'-phosphate oxidase-domain-containing protein [Biscogniauxia marginata]